LLEVLLHHPSLVQDQQVVAKLLQTSKHLAADIGNMLAGKLHVQLHVSMRRSVHAFAQWLRKHAGMLQQLQVHFARSSFSILNAVQSRSMLITAAALPWGQKKQQGPAAGIGIATCSTSDRQYCHPHCSKWQNLVPCSCSPSH
jgi:hypothetical protein